MSAARIGEPSSQQPGKAGVRPAVTKPIQVGGEPMAAAGPMTLETLEAALASNKVAATYLIGGTDEGEVRRAVHRVQDYFCPEQERQWSLELLDGTEVDALTVLDAASTAPMLGQRRVVVVHHADRLAQSEELIPFIENPPDFAVLVLVVGAMDKRRRLYTAVTKHGVVVECNKVQGDTLVRRVHKLAAARRIRLAPEAMDILLERAGDDMGRIEMEVDKLAAFGGEDAIITKDDAARLVAFGHPQAGQYAIFDFVDAISQGNSGEALRRLDELLAAGQAPLAVLTMIARQFRLLLGALAWQGAPLAVAAEGVGLKSTFPMRKAFAHANQWTREAVVDALGDCAACDAAIKRGTDGRQALEALTVQLVWRHRRQ